MKTINDLLKELHEMLQYADEWGSNQTERKEQFELLNKIKAMQKAELRENAIVQINKAIKELNEIGIECSFDESTLIIKHHGDN